MAQAKRKLPSMDALKSKYSDITKLYDFADELLNTVESQFVSDPEQQIDIVEPLIHEIGEATDVLASEFLLIAESKRGKVSTKISKPQIEASLRRIFAAISDYQARVKTVGKRAQGAINNIADPIVTKLLRHVEEIVVIFLEFVNLSLQAIMNKAELEAIKIRDPRIALMMHQHAMQQQQ